MSCVKQEEGSAGQAEVPAAPEPIVEAPLPDARPVEARRTVAWGARREGRATFEGKAGSGLLLSRLAPSRAPAVGGVIRLAGGLHHRVAYSGDCPADRMGWEATILAVPTLGLVFVPDSAWLGNDRGAELRVQGALARGGGPGSSLAVGVAPVLAVEPWGSRVRYPSIVGFLVPEAGVIVARDPRVSAYVHPARLPFAFLLHDRVGLEVEPELWVAIPLAHDPDVGVAFILAVSIVAR